MPDAVLGLDIGPQAINAVLLVGRGASGGQVLAAESVVIDEQGGLEPALKKLAENVALKDVSCCVCLSPDNVMFRQVSLPFRDDKKIKKTLAFELEPLIPLPRDEVVIDYLKSEEGYLLVAAVAKKVIRDLIEAVQNNLSANIVMIDVSPVALAQPVMGKVSTDECAMILDIGASTTTACFYENGAVVQVRSFSFGGGFLAETLAQEMSLEKDDVFSLLSDITPDNVVKDVAGLCREFCQDLEHTVEMMKIKGVLKKDISRIILTGGGAVFSFLINELEDCFSVPVEILDLARMNKTEIAQNIREKYHPQIMNTALAAAMKLFSRRRGFDFRQGEFAAKKGYFNIKKQLRAAAVVALIIIILGAANLLVGYALQSYRAGIMKKQIAAIFKKNFPEAQAMIDPLQQLKTKLDEDRKMFSFYQGGQGTLVADMLKEISELIPPSTNVVLSGFSYENGVLLLSGQTQRMEIVSLVEAELLKSKYFKNVSVGSSSLTKEGDKVEFSMRIELK